MSGIPSSVLIPTGLIGGFAVVKATHHRHWGGAFAAVAGLGAAERCRRRAGVGRALLLGTTYATALAGSHPLARKIGAWPSVLAVTAAATATAGILERRPRN